MDRISNFIIKQRKLIIAVFIIATIISGIASVFVKVNYSMMDYLPEDSASTIALDVMDEEYKQAPPNARAMVSDVTLLQAKDIKQEIQKVEGVDEVTWLDDSVNIYEPLEMIDKDILESYYKNNKALYTITVNEDEELSTKAIEGIQEIIGENGNLSGSIVDTVTARQTTSSEINLIMLFIIPIIFLILILTTTSWFEPVLFLGTIGVAVMLNRGTNLFIGEISFVTNSAGSILQLAVSMDYSIFLLHQFEACRKSESNVERAMKMALKVSVSSVLSSGLTTVVGFIALILMRFRIGPDMGIVMAKAVVLSLLTVLILLPALTLETYHLIDKTKHKLLIPPFGWLGKLVYKTRFVMVGIFIISLLPCYLAQGSNIFLYGESGIFNDDSTKVGHDKHVINEEFGESNPFVLMVPRGDAKKEQILNKDLLAQDYVKSVTSYSNSVSNQIPNEYVPTNILEQLMSEHYSRFVITVEGNDVDGSSFVAVEGIRELGKKYYGDKALVAGSSPSTYDLRTVVTEDNIRVNSVAIGSIFFILFINFKSLILPVILTLLIEAAIWMNLTVPYFAEVQLNYIAYLIISSVQLGATIDYAILFTSKYLGNREMMKKKDAVIETVSGTFLSIFTSAIIMILSGIALSIVCTNGVIKQLGTLVGRGAFISIILVMFVLPILLMICDKVIARTTKNVHFYQLELTHLPKNSKLGRFVEEICEKYEEKQEKVHITGEEKLEELKKRAMQRKERREEKKKEEALKEKQSQNLEREETKKLNKENESKQEGEDSNE
ncbi:MAG: RND family transporter [Lachnospiraceae bacterium]